MGVDTHERMLQVPAAFTGKFGLEDGEGVWWTLHLHGD